MELGLLPQDSLRSMVPPLCVALNQCGAGMASPGTSGVGLNCRGFPPRVLVLRHGCGSRCGSELSRNKLTGTLPTQLGRMTGLRQVWLQDNDLTGPIPTELGRITQMYQLLMNLNGFSGTIPTQFGQFTAYNDAGVEVM
jgi:hypothetical protein